MLVLTGCVDKEEAESVMLGKITLSEIGVSGNIHNSQTAWQVLDMADFDIWVIYIKQDKLSTSLSPSPTYCITVNGKEYDLKTTPFNPNILKLILPTNQRAVEPEKITIQTKSARENSSMKNDVPLSIKHIYITKDALNDTLLNEINIDTYTDLYAGVNKTNFAYDNGQFIRPSHVKSNEENAYTVNTYFDARTMAITESATGAFQFLKDVDNYEDYIIMENPNRFRMDTEVPTELLAPDDRWRIRQIGTIGEMGEGN